MYTPCNFAERNNLRILLIVLVMAVTGCGGGGGGSGGKSDSANTDTPTPPDARQRPVLGTLNLPFTNASATLAFANAFPALPDFSQPVYLTHSGDGSNRLFVVEQAGLIKVFANSPSTDTTATFLDLRSKVASGGEMGLLGLAFDPDYASNGYFYVYYTAYTCPGGGRCSVLSRFQVSSDPDAANPSSETVILKIPQPYANHNGGTITFGPDGMLYWGLGDGGGVGDPDGNGQNTATLLGAMLRIDVRSGSPYAIPADNPFTASDDGIADEIWAYGLRNPYRFSFDRSTGRLWLADVGQNVIEEIDIITKGGNYGWNWYEGTQVYTNGAPAQTFIDPVFQYDHNEGISITGGYVYRGTAVTSLQGRYIYGDFSSAKIWALSVNADLHATDNVLLGTLPESVSAFGEDEAGELYVVGYGGHLYKFTGSVASSTLTGFPSMLSATGLFLDTAQLIPASGVIAYDVAMPLWTDHAAKQRWIALPNNGTITFSADGNWQFPVGTVLVKNFAMDMTVDDPTTRRNLETRILIRQPDNWVGASYRWNTQQTDAQLLNGGLSETLTINDPAAPGGVRTQNYPYPAPTQCTLCHSLAAGRVLGVRTRQINSTHTYDDGEDNQLDYWNEIGLFSADIGASSQYAAHPALTDETVAVGQRARAYLEANCSSCHTKGGTPNVDMDMRSTVALSDMKLVDVTPAAGTLGITDAKIIAPGDHTRSVLWQRIQSTDSSIRMPRLGSNVPHPEGVSVIADWIDSL